MTGISTVVGHFCALFSLFTLMLLAAPAALSQSEVYSDLGTLLNVPGQQWPAEITEAHDFANEILVKALDGQREKFKWHIEIRDNPEILAGAHLIESDKTLSTAVITLSTGLLSFLETKSELAFILLHEVTHHLEGHTRAMFAHSIHNKVSSQSEEAVADKGALDLMTGKYNLLAAYNVLNKVSKADADDMDQRQQREMIIDSLTADHHNPGLRATMLHQQIERTVHDLPSTGNVADEEIPSQIKNLSKRYQGKMPPELVREVFQEINDWAHYKKLDLFSREGLDYARGYFRNLPDIWQYSDSDEFLKMILHRLPQKFSPEFSADVLLVLLSQKFFSGANEVLRTSDKTTKTEVERILAGLKSDRQFNGLIDHKSNGVDDWLSQLDRSDELHGIIVRLAARHPGWNNFMSFIKSQRSPRGKQQLLTEFPFYKKVKTEWHKIKAKQYLLALDALSDAELKEYLGREYFLLSKLTPAPAAKIYSSLVGSQRYQAVVNRLRAQADEYYNTTKENLDKKHAEFQVEWIRAFHADPERNGNRDFDLFLQSMLKYGTQNFLEYFLSDREAWGDLNKLLLKKIMAYQKVSSQEKLRLLVQMKVMGDSSNYIDLLIAEDTQFKQDLTKVVASVADPIAVILRTHAKRNYQLETIYLLYQERMIPVETLQSGAGLVQLNEILSTAETKEFSKDSARLILEWARLQAVQGGGDKGFQIINEALMKVSDRNFIPPEIVAAFTPILKETLLKMNVLTRLQYLRNPLLWRALSKDQLLPMMADDFEKMVAEQKDRNKVWDLFTQGFNFAKSNRVFAHELRNIIAERAQQQPLANNEAYGIYKPSDTQAASEYAMKIRLWSAVASALHIQNFADQLTGLDYLMGRSATVPTFAKQLHQEDKGAHNILELFDDLRSQLSTSEEVGRAMFVQSVLEGPQAKILNETHRTDLFKYLGNFLASGQRDAALDIFVAVIEAEKHRSVILLSQILSQKTIDATSMLRIGLQNYFVVGTKFGQYLAFTGEFKEYEEVLAKFQDAVPVRGYYDLMVYLHEQLSKKVNLSEIKVTRILGAGTVNMAFEYIDLKTGEERVIQIPRQNIEQQTTRDFARFREFAKALAKRSSGGRDYSFVAGLTGVIERSIQLEFNRSQTLLRQNEAVQIYEGQRIGDWNLRSVQAFSQEGQAILMQKAPGVTMKNIWQTDPRLYKRLMGGLYDFEHQRIFKTLRGSQRLANPDLHDGQVLVDLKSKTVTVIDFGQALPIDQREIDFALEIISSLSGVKSEGRSLSMFSNWVKRSNPQGDFGVTSLDKVMAKTGNMDRFVRLIAALESKSAPLPLNVIHMVLQVNRLAKLGQKIGKYPRLSMGFDLVRREYFKQRLRAVNLSLGRPRVKFCREL